MEGKLRYRRLALLAGMLLMVAEGTLAAADAASCGLWRPAGRAGDHRGGATAPLDPGFVRIQVVANSDSQEDQRVKAVIRDLLRERLGEQANTFASAKDALTYVRDALPELEAAVRAALAAHKCRYDCALAVGDMAFPAKSYGGLVVSPGEYPALRVALGQARGANWWCVLFPPLCFVDIGTGLAQEPAASAGRHGAGPGDEDELLAAIRAALGKDGAGRAPGGLRMRSWLLEKLRDSGWWDRLRQVFRAAPAAGAGE